MCENVLQYCLISPSNVCYRYNASGVLIYSPFKTIGEFAIYAAVFFVGQVYIVGNREMAQRINHYRDDQLLSQKKILEEKENKVLDLLKRMLPESVAYKLKNKSGVIADNFDEISILFTDMKGFTAYSSTVSPVDLMRFLDRMFSTFDKIAGRVTKKKIEKY